MKLGFVFRLPSKSAWAVGVCGFMIGTGLVGVGLWISGYGEPPEQAVAKGPVQRSAGNQTSWEMVDPASLQLDPTALGDLAQLVKGSGFVAYQGKGVFRWGHDHRPRYAASVKKSVISVLMLQALEQGRIGSLDEPVARFEPRLADLNEGRDGGMTWRHLANMLSGYGLVERPGEAFAYNDYAVALWYDTLMAEVYREKGTEVLRRQLAEPLGFEDAVTFQAFGSTGPEPKLRISARDLARFGQLLLNGGQWQGKQVLSAKSMDLLLNSVVPVSVPLSGGQLEPMLPGQKTVGGWLNISPIGPGRYTFHLWRNRRGPQGLLMLPQAPEDTLLATGKWGEAALWVIPSLELVVAWNGSEIDDHHIARHEPTARINQASLLMVKAVRGSDKVVLSAPRPLAEGEP